MSNVRVQRVRERNQFTGCPQAVHWSFSGRRITGERSVGNRKSRAKCDYKQRANFRFQTVCEVNNVRRDGVAPVAISAFIVGSCRARLHGPRRLKRWKR